MVNDVSSPELVELMKAFHAMMTIVKFANITLGSGDVDVAKQSYIDALILFIKLKNDRGVSEHKHPPGSLDSCSIRGRLAEAKKDQTARSELRSCRAHYLVSTLRRAYTIFRREHVSVCQSRFLFAYSLSDAGNISRYVSKGRPHGHEYA